MHEFVDRLRRELADRYDIDRELGRGGMAVVYLARDLKHDRAVALKVLRPELAESLGAERFLREIDIAAKLSHPHIVPVYDSGQANGIVFFTMPYVEGESLRTRLQQESRLSVDDAARVTRDVATALSYAHGQGVVHRDIKPENILLTQGMAVVADFGIARAVNAAGGDALTRSGFPLGTLGYMSPEQAAGGHELDRRTDVYSLGCVLYEMLVGRTPQRWLDRDALEEGHITDAAPDERTQLDSLPEPMERLLVRMLAQAPDRRFATAEDVVAALDAVTSGGTRGSLPPPPGPLRSGRRALLTGVVAAALVLAAGVIGVMLSRGEGEFDPNRIAVAPFDVLESEFAPWREGLVDLLSAQLDGAGPLHAVPPSTVLRRWDGRADAVSAARLGSNLRAGLVLVGRVVGAGQDSARVLATLLDVEAGATIAEFDLRDHADRIDRLADSLAVQLMTGLSHQRRISVWRLASLGSSSPAAIKAFLQGEQHYRDFGLDSAVAYYDRAIQLDSAFALAYSRRANAGGWFRDLGPDFTRFLLRAGELNHGLARRESLLVAADSIEGALARFAGDTTSWRLLNRLFTTLEYASQRYPTDPQVWFELGEARYHFGPVLGLTDRVTYEAFRRAVALDSAFVPAYRHQIELALLLGEPEAAERVAADYLSRSDPSGHRDAAAVTAALLDPQRRDDPRTQAALEALSGEALYQVWYDVKWSVDSVETSTRVARTWHAVDPGSGGRLSHALALAYRGHLSAASELVADGEPALFAVLAQLGAISEDSAAARFAAWLGERNILGMFNAHRYWAATGDTAALARAVLAWDSLAAAGRQELSYWRRNAGRSARAYLALARGDSLGAVRLLETVRVWPGNYFNYYERLTRAQLLSRLGRNREAAELLDRIPFLREWPPAADAIVVELERGRVHEHLDNREIALRAYGTVLDAWATADPILQPLVVEAREAIARLTAETRK